MTEAKFTPGPWDLGPWEMSRRKIITPSGQFMQATVVAEVLTGNIADDRLIAAAPDLFVAAEKALNYITNTEGEFGITLDSGNALRAALAKARGEHQ